MTRSDSAPSPAAILRNNPLQIITSILVIGGLVFLPAFPDTAKKFIYTLELAALAYVVLNIRKLPPINKLEKIFFVIIVCNFVWIAFTYHFNGSPEQGENLVWNRQFFMLLTIPLYYLFRRIKVPVYAIWGAIAISIAISFGSSLPDLDPGNTGIYSTRAQGGGAMHPIWFGYQILTMTSYLLLSFFDFKNNSIRLLSFVAVSAGFLIVIWTQSRGVWAALPIIPLIIIFYSTQTWPFTRRLFLALICTLILASTYLHPTVKQRIDKTITNIHKYQVSELASDPARRSSIGARFEMWKTGWYMFLDNPVTGVGLGGYQENTPNILQQHQINPSVSIFKHPHSQYLSALATRGFPGFLLLIGLIVLPVAIGHSKLGSSNPSIKAPYYAVITIPLLFAIFGLSDVPFEDKQAILLYSILIAHSLAYIANSDQEQSRIQPHHLTR